MESETYLVPDYDRGQDDSPRRPAADGEARGRDDRRGQEQPLGLCIASASGGDSDRQSRQRRAGSSSTLTRGGCAGPFPHWKRPGALRFCYEEQTLGFPRRTATQRFPRHPCCIRFSLHDILLCSPFRARTQNRLKAALTRESRQGNSTAFKKMEPRGSSCSMSFPSTGWLCSICVA